MAQVWAQWDWNNEKWIKAEKGENAIDFILRVEREKRKAEQEEQTDG